ncbi:copper resistance protein B, partial [Pseudoalteromonas sp. S983]
GFRVRYEFTRQFAPYVGVEWTNKFGNTADFAKLNGQSTRDTAFVAGIKFWL